MTFARRALSAALVSALLLPSGCDEGPLDDSANNLRFTSSAIVWQRSAGEVRSVFLVETLGGRLFAFINARGTDGNDAIFQSERVGTNWELPFQLPRASGAVSERVEWALTAPTPVLITVGASGGSGAIYSREFNGSSWFVSFQASTPGAETPSMVRVAAGTPGGPGRRTLHIAYATTGLGGACTNAMTLVHRVSFAVGTWQGPDIIGTACDPQDLGFVVSHTTGDPLVAVWNGATATGGREVDYAYSRMGVPAAFGPAQRVPLVQGEPAETRAVAVGASSVLATWVQAGSPRRAAYSVFDPTTTAWSTPNPNWFVTSLAPWTAESTFGTALVIASETDAPFTRLMVRRFQSSSRPIASASVVRAPAGNISSPRVITAADGSVHAAWIESPGNGGVTQVWWASAAGSLSDAGAVLDAPAPTDARVSFDAR